MNTEFLESLVKKEDVVKQALTKLYRGVRATNEFLGLKNSPELQSTYYKLRVEEVGELFTAIENEDKVEFLDAVVDGLVIVGYEFLINTLDNPDNCIYNGDGDDIHKELDWINNSFRSISGYEDTLAGLESVFNQMDIDHIKSVEEVLSSNWSKFPTLSEFEQKMKNDIEGLTDKVTYHDLANLQIMFIGQQDRYVDVFYEIRYDESIQEDRIIFWAKGEKQSDDGTVKEFKAPKYVKPCTFKEPDFASCWRT